MSRIQRIEQKLTENLHPFYLKVEDETMNHHAPISGETHIKLTAVCKAFDDLTRVQRHKIVNQLLALEFDLGLHALSMHLFTEAEWQKRGGEVQNSPNCKDGFGH